MKRRNTPSKQAVLDILLKSDEAISHDVIMGMVDLDINRATVYRILNQFCEDGLVHSIVAEDGKQYFAIQKCKQNDPMEHHFHFRCISCDTISCLDQEIQIKLPAGYVMEKANCVVTGVCGNCA